MSIIGLPHLGYLIQRKPQALLKLTPSISTAISFEYKHSVILYMWL